MMGGGYDVYFIYAYAVWNETVAGVEPGLDMHSLHTGVYIILAPNPHIFCLLDPEGAKSDQSWENCKFISERKLSLTTILNKYEYEDLCQNGRI